MSTQEPPSQEPSPEATAQESPPAPPPAAGSTQDSPPPAPPPQGPAATQPVYVAHRGNGLGTAGFVCGLLATIFGLIPFLFLLSFVLGALGIIFGGVGWRRAKREPDRGGKGLSIAGFILGLIGLVLAIVSVIAINAALD